MTITNDLKVNVLIKKKKWPGPNFAATETRMQLCLAAMFPPVTEDNEKETKPPPKLRGLELQNPTTAWTLMLTFSDVVQLVMDKRG